MAVETLAAQGFPNQAFVLLRLFYSPDSGTNCRLGFPYRACALPSMAVGPMTVQSLTKPAFVLRAMAVGPIAVQGLPKSDFVLPPMAVEPMTIQGVHNPVLPSMAVGPMTVQAFPNPAFVLLFRQ